MNLILASPSIYITSISLISNISSTHDNISLQLMNRSLIWIKHYAYLLIITEDIYLETFMASNHGRDQKKPKEVGHRET